MALQTSSIEDLAAQYASSHPRDIIALALERYAPDVIVSFSGAEDVVLLDMTAEAARHSGASYRVFTLDTGRLHPETLQYLETVRDHYHVTIEAFSPQPTAVQDLVREKGLFSFYREGHEECCGIRKVEPIRRALAPPVRAYITGQRKDQSPSTRADIPVAQLDTGFAEAGRELVKFNPLASWSSQQVWEYIRANEVPYNPLHDRGFRSIGCAPCTKPTNPGEHERAGRWWWEEATIKECGLHAINVKL